MRILVLFQGGLFPLEFGKLVTGMLNFSLQRLEALKYFTIFLVRTLVFFYHFRELGV
jgi:hypothetical protein